MVTITPIEDGKGQLSINVGPNKIRLDCSSPKNAVKLSDEDYALCKESLAPWVGRKVTVIEDPSNGTDVLAEVDAGAEAEKAAAKPKKRRGLLSRASRKG